MAAKKYILEFEGIMDLSRKFDKLKSAHSQDAEITRLALDELKVPYTPIDMGVMIDLSKVPADKTDRLMEILKRERSNFKAAAEYINTPLKNGK